MFCSFLVLCAALTFAETKTLAVQIQLDRQGYSCNTIDGQWGQKSQAALERYCRVRKCPVPATPEEAYDRYFAAGGDLFVLETLDARDFAAFARIPSDPAEKAKLDWLGYESIAEMLAERGHVSVRTLERLNPGLDWAKAGVGTRVRLPKFPRAADYLAAGKGLTAGDATRPAAARLEVSPARFEIAAYDARGALLGLFPCSIAKDKAKVPRGELRVVSLIPNPNYTYTPERRGKGAPSRQIFAPGPNNPVGVAWIGLSLPGYGIHGTPTPERVGCAESHGCFRLANWNVARLYALCRIGTRVVVTP